MNVLIIVPSFKILGGVANHYMGLAPYWKENVSYCFYGKRKHIPAWLSLIPDLCYYIVLLAFKKIDVVIVNPSLRKYQLIRDGLYLLIAKLFNKKVVTFIHGFDENLVDRFIKSPEGMFQKVYNKSTFIYVLYSGFKKQLVQAGIKKPILLSTTKVHDSYLRGFDIANRSGSIRKILFLARINKAKGIYVAIDAYKILKEKYQYLQLNVCGTGSELKNVQRYVEKENIGGINFKGLVSGNELIKEYVDCDIYILPTTHQEGMATSVLEAMAFGLPVISRPVGGINDFFINGKMGYLLESLEAGDYAITIEHLLEHPEIVKDMGAINNLYAKEHFIASKVVRKIESDIKMYCDADS